MNSRMDEIQAAILRVKLKYLDQDNRRRIKLAETYDKELKDSPITKPGLFTDLRHVYHQYAIRTTSRERIKRPLSNKWNFHSNSLPAPHPSTAGLLGEI
jgi:dTDP-4-amino-4,6-dideoxygalactose transaminase